MKIQKNLIFNFLIPLFVIIFFNSCDDDQNIDIKETYIPDDNFENKLIELGFDDVLDDYVLMKNIEDIDRLDLYGLQIKDLTGIEDFKSLKYLDCGGNQLTHLDLSNNKSLTELHCYRNQLTNLDVSENILLTVLRFELNQITNMDISANTSIKELRCEFNQLTNLILGHNTSLTWLSCGYNKLTSLDLSGNTSLKFLFCENNRLTNLDVRSISLFHFQCHDNQLTNLSLSNKSDLQHLFCSNNKLTNLDVSNNTLLSNFNCVENELTCIRVNQTQLDNIPTEWFIDTDVLYSLDCI